jgi:hypothetical protein
VSTTYVLRIPRRPTQDENNRIIGKLLYRKFTLPSSNEIAYIIPHESTAPSHMIVFPVEFEQPTVLTIKAIEKAFNKMSFSACRIFENQMAKQTSYLVQLHFRGNPNLKSKILKIKDVVIQDFARPIRGAETYISVLHFTTTDQRVKSLITKNAMKATMKATMKMGNLPIMKYNVIKYTSRNIRRRASCKYQNIESSNYHSELRSHLQHDDELPL